MATITKVKGKKSVSFQVRYRINGNQKTESFTTREKTQKALEKIEKEANKFAKKIEARKTLGIAKEEKNITFIKYGEGFLEIHTLELKDTSKTNYYGSFNYLKKYFGNIKIKDITPPLLDKFFYHLRKKKKMSMNGINNYKIVLNMILKSAYKKDVIINNPMDRIDFKFTDDTDNSKKKILTHDEVEIFVHNLSAYYYKFFTLIAYNTGMRRGEILALRWQNVDLINRIIYVKESWNYLNQVTTPKTKSSIRSIYMHDNLYNILIKIKQKIKENKKHFNKAYVDNDLVVCKPNGEYISIRVLSREFFNTSEKIGIKTRPHMLRHTFATKLRQIEAKDVQALLGHSTLDMTINTYQHHDHYQPKTINDLNKLFKQKNIIN